MLCNLFVYVALVHVYGVARVSSARFWSAGGPIHAHTLNSDRECAFIGQNLLQLSVSGKKEGSAGAGRLLTHYAQRGDSKGHENDDKGNVTKNNRQKGFVGFPEGNKSTEDARQEKRKNEGEEPVKTKKPLKSLKHESNFDIYPLKYQTEGDQQVPTLPPSEFRPKQSLGQNFITDWNIMAKMCNSLEFEPCTGNATGKQVVELGAGIGSLTQILFKKYPEMTAIEIDARAISQLSRTIPDLDVIHDDVLQVDYKSMANVKGEKLWIIGNLPFYITSQILFCLVDYKQSIDRAVVTAQLEVARRIVANPGDHDYSILSVVLQLYATPKLLFTIPNRAFYPKPKVHAGVIRLIFEPEKQPKCAPLILKRILRDSFGQKRKKLKTSLSQFLEQQEIGSLPHPLPDLRPQQLSPKEFESLARWIEKNGNFTNTPKSYKLSDNRRTRARMGPEALEIPPRIWRQEKHGE